MRRLFSTASSLMKNKTHFQRQMMKARSNFVSKQHINLSEHATHVHVGKLASSPEMNRSLNQNFPKAKVQYHGNTARILSTMEDDGTALDHLMTLVEEHQPLAMVLGDLTPRDLRYYTVGERVFFLAGPKSSLQFSAEDVIARKKFSQFFMQNQQCSTNVYLCEESDNLYYVD